MLALRTASDPRVAPDLPPARPELTSELLETPPTVVLDDLQASLIELARLLDEQSGAEDIGLETGVADLEAGDSVLDYPARAAGRTVPGAAPGRSSVPAQLLNSAPECPGQDSNLRPAD